MTKSLVVVGEVEEKEWKPSAIARMNRTLGEK
jgi:hypothetical protein